MIRYWIGVASREHVKRGETGGFCQLCHGKSSPLKRMSPGDWIIYYSPNEMFGKRSPCKRFTAIGQITGETVYPFQMSEDFVPFRRDVSFKPCKEIPIQPLINQFEFIRNKRNWGYVFRFGHFEINQTDFDLLIRNMLIEEPPAESPKFVYSATQSLS